MLRSALACVAACAPTSAATALATPSRLPPAPDRQLSFLHVGTTPGGPSSLAQVADQSGRQVLLRGVNVDGLSDYFRTDLRPPYPTDPAAYSGGACPPDDPTVEGVMVCGFDLAQMRPLGFDAIRLTISWSELEPAPGQISQQYLDRIAQVVAWARAQGIYVVLDMHQDAWSKYVFTAPGQSCPPPTRAVRGYDGAPQWASAHNLPACAVNGTRELDGAVAEDFQALYNDQPAPDGVGLQEHFASLFVALALRFAADPTVAGYEILNEPNPGLNPTPSMDASELFPLYAKVVRTVLAHVPSFRQLFFIEPNTTRDVTDQSAIATPWSAYSSYRNVVYAPHVYTGVFTLDQQALGAHVLPLDGGYRSAVNDAHALGLPLWVGEFGNNPSDDDTLLRTHFTLQDQLGLGGALWLWKENANDVNGSVFWGVYGKPFGTGVPQPHRILYVSRAFAEAVAGDLTSQTYDPGLVAFDLRASSPAVPSGDRAGATLVFVPANVSGAVRAVGAGVQTFDRGGGAREAYVYPRGGAYHVFIQAVSGASPSGSPSPRARCVSARRFVIHLHPRGGLRVTRALVYLGHRRVRVLAGPRLRATVDLRGLPRGTFTVTILLYGREHGRRVSQRAVRRYRTCRASRRRAPHRRRRAARRR